jgi:hypothetical protein
MGQNTYGALKCLIDNSYYGQLSYPPSLYDYRNDSSHRGYFKEFCTVKMCTARQSGHSTALCKVAWEYFDKVAFLSPNYSMAERLSSRFQKSIVNKDIDCKDIVRQCKSELVTKNGYYLFGSYRALERFCDYDCEAVFIDGTFEMTDTIENNIYLAFGPVMWKYSQRFFVFVE